MHLSVQRGRLYFLNRKHKVEVRFSLNDDDDQTVHFLCGTDHEVYIFFPEECTTDPCVNGECIEGHKSRTCICPSSYTGDACEIPKDQCAGNPCCSDPTDCHAVCVQDYQDKTVNYTCLCTTGYKPSKHCSNKSSF